MSGTLYVVATPIGNLEDVTFRALRVLRDVSLIAAEDTRHTSRLLQHYSISTPTTSLHKHNERAKTAGLIQRLLRGDAIALVSDAGTPVVSDPGARLVAAAHAAGIRVEPIPGPSAAMAALSASGFDGDQFVFLGFPPARRQARRSWLGSVASERRPLIIFEAPHRIAETLKDIEQILGDRVVAVGRELTKVHEELIVKRISEHLKKTANGRGEYVLVIQPNHDSSSAAGRSRNPPTSAEVVHEFGLLTIMGRLGRRAAIKQLALKYHLRARDVYNLLESEGDRSYDQ
jgi:16S rRNA (cytidine1402-2'-O)-methyltransferase